MIDTCLNNKMPLVTILCIPPTDSSIIYTRILDLVTKIITKNHMQEHNKLQIKQNKNK
jgi:hypothetical protein